MDARLFRPYALQQEHEFRVRGLEFKLLDGSREAPARRDEAARSTATAQQAWDRYVGATRFAEMRRMIYQTPIRETVSPLVRIGSHGARRVVGAYRPGVGRRIYLLRAARRARQRSALRLPRASRASS